MNWRLPVVAGLVACVATGQSPVALAADVELSVIADTRPPSGAAGDVLLEVVGQ